MATFTWTGGYGLYDTPANWDQAGVPGAGDTAVIGGGGALALFEAIPATVVLGGTDPSARPVLGLLDASLATLTMPRDLPQPPYTTDTSPTRYGTVVAAGTDRIGSIELGAFANLERFGPPGSTHPPLFAPDDLTVALIGRAGLSAGFDVKQGSTLTVRGGEGSSFDATNGLIEAGRVVIDAPLGGEGRIFMDTGTVSPGGEEGSPGTLELGGGVGAGQTIDLRIGELILDQPMRFLGQLDIHANENIPGLPDPSAIGEQSVLLKGLVATSWNADYAAHTLTLYDGDAVVDQLRLTPDVTYPALTGAAQTGDGVLLRGLFASNPPGATELPVHAS